MQISEVMSQLEKLGSEQTRKTFARHGADPKSMFGVKVGDLKILLRKLRGQQDLAMQLFETGNSDAMYLAGMIADGARMSRRQLDNWAKAAPWYMISEYTVSGVACEHPDAPALADKWINSRKPNIQTSGWTTWSGIVATRPDSELDMDHLKALLKRVESEIETGANRVRYTMNGFVISVGSYVKPLLPAAKATAKAIGKVSVDVGQTDCKVPLATEYIAKVEKMGRVGKKRSTMKC